MANMIRGEIMKNLYGLAAALSLASCAHETGLYKDNFQKEVPVTSHVIKFDYLCDDNGTNYEIRLYDKPRGESYRLIRNMNTKEISLEKITEYAEME
jgi:hypothetical protein